jgi:thiol-disulfide isomerase/thioredoxin
MRSYWFGALGCLLALAALAFAFWPGSTNSASAPQEAGAKKTNPLVAMAKRFGLPETGAATNTNLKIGDTLPPLDCVDLAGQPIDVNTLFGEKATLVVCWATWCSPCMQALPHEAKLARAYRNKGLNVIGVNADDEPELARGAMRALGIDWPTIHEPNHHPPASGVVRSLGVKSWPTLLLFDKDRKLIAASPDLNLTKYTPEDAGGNLYAVRSLDWALTKLLGPLEWNLFISPVY